MKRLACHFLLALTLVLNGCTTMLTVTMPPPPEAPWARRLHTDDVVDVTLRTGEVRRFRISAVEADALVGKDQRIPYAHIQEVQVRRFSLARTAGTMAAVLLAAELVVAGLAVANW